VIASQLPLTVAPSPSLRIRSLSPLTVWVPRTGLCAFTVGAQLASAFDWR
jgi:hypothetical protein